MDESIRYDGDRELARFEVELNGRPVIIDIPRSVVEDYKRSPALTPVEFLEFVARNRHQIAANVAYYTRHAPDVTGMQITEEQLRGCD